MLYILGFHSIYRFCLAVPAGPASFPEIFFLRKIPQSPKINQAVSYPDLFKATGTAAATSSSRPPIVVPCVSSTSKPYTQTSRALLRMANAKGSSAGGTGGAGHGGDLGRAISHEQYQAFLASVHRAAAPGAANVHHHQYPAGLIQSPPMAMPAHHVPVPRPQIAVPPPQPFARPPEHSGQSQPPTGQCCRPRAC